MSAIEILKKLSEKYYGDANSEIMGAIAEVKAKDEEIKNLNCRAYHAEGYINDLHNNPKVKKFYDKKARSIVAMLFWEWHKLRAENGVCFSYDAYKAEERFKKAYKMLKDTQ